MSSRLLLVAVVATFAMGCSGGKRHDASVGEVKRTLAAAQFQPQKVKLGTTIATKPQFPPPQVDYCAAEAVAQPRATSLDVDHGRAIVMVFATGGDADDWTPMPECRAKPLRLATSSPSRRTGACRVGCDTHSPVSVDVAAPTQGGRGYRAAVTSASR